MRIEYFQLIDRIVDLNLREAVITTEARVPETSTIFEGHFPGRPLMPGVLLIEAMAQTAGWLIIATAKFERMAFLAAVKDAKFRTFVEPGQTLTLTSSIIHNGSGYAVAAARAQVGGKSVCDATVTFRTTEFPDPRLRHYMQETATRLEFPFEAVADG
jgi:3-hydroxyacyl-[acyl-carrier-protein] dehydratase